MLRNSMGDWLEEKNEICELVVNFFKSLFYKENSNYITLEIMSRFYPIHEVDNKNLSKVISYNEVKKAILSMGATKAPGSDGFPALFF